MPYIGPSLLSAEAGCCILNVPDFPLHSSPLAPHWLPMGSLLSLWNPADPSILCHSGFYFLPYCEPSSIHVAAEDTPSAQTLG